MSSITAAASPIKGRMAAPPSKSAAHRALICAALAGGGGIQGVSDSDDMRATLGAIRALGLHAEQNGDTVTVSKAVNGREAGKTKPVIVDCRESGSTLRLLIPLFAALGIHCLFTGGGRLPRRPLGVYADCLPPHGVKMIYSAGSGLPLELRGRLQAGRFEVPGDVSSQFISGLLLALPLCGGDSEIVLTTPLESAAYVELTTDAMREAGVTAEHTAEGWRVPGNQSYRPHRYNVEGDWSQAAFLMAMGILGGEMTITGMNLNSRQGDREILNLARRFGADVTITPEGILCWKSELHGMTIDASQVPDLVPVLAVLGALAKGTTTITGAARLRIKESDRLAAVSDCLNKLGGHVEETADGLRIEGVDSFRGGVTVSGYNDHRIVMSMAVAALACDAPVTIEDAESVAKSWPAFFEVYKESGGEAHGF